jgi:hypothetical protein
MIAGPEYVESGRDRRLVMAARKRQEDKPPI